MLGDTNITITDLRNYKKANLDRGFFPLFQGLKYSDEVQLRKLNLKTFQQFALTKNFP